jgi:hypothetical protein
MIVEAQVALQPDNVYFGFALLHDPINRAALILLIQSRLLQQLSVFTWLGRNIFTNCGQ